MNSRLIRILVLCLLVCGIVAGVCWLFFLARGAEVREDPRAVVARLLTWIRVHPIHALLWLFGLYIVMTLLLLPVWSLQMMCGFALCRIFGTLIGVAMAVGICQIAATLAAMITF